MNTRETPNRSGRHGEKVSLVVIHGDAGKSDNGTISWIENEESQVSYHYLIGRDGDVYQFVPEDQKAWHSGRSEWEGCTVVSRRGVPSVNPTSIGVAFANDGSGDEDYKLIQYVVGARLVADICERHDIPIGRVVGHDQVSPGRKTDPWKWFDWRKFYGLVGMFGSKRRK